ncbi:MAG: 50S ribosomal protein L3 N(5)-glutamine methyltransferase [Gammaproteobacteria bacterium]|nr:50S ribosomal protein L3 N(5)-glutamine methyltransferase [Gammaproteobacteria bacterium]
MSDDTDTLRTATDLVLWAEKRFEQAGLSYGHGTTSARDDAVLLVFHAAGLAWDCPEEAVQAALPAAVVRQAIANVDARIETRKPAAYITREMWFAGIDFYCDERVLVPRSPIAELVECGFEPWIDASRVQRVLDVCTGSGCIALAAAAYLPEATVDGTDISDDALAVAAINLERLGLAERVRFFKADLFPAEKGLYDVIVSNPPYVPSQAVLELPAEYQAEPALGLDGGVDGMDPVRRLMAESAAWLQPGGILIIEVGGEVEALEQVYPHIPFTWVEFERGGDGVYVITREELERYV